MAFAVAGTVINTTAAVASGTSWDSVVASQITGLAFGTLGGTIGASLGGSGLAEIAGSAIAGGVAAAFTRPVGARGDLGDDIALGAMQSAFYAALRVAVRNAPALSQSEVRAQAPPMVRVGSAGVSRAGSGGDPLSDRSRFAGAQYAVARELAAGHLARAVEIAARFWNAQVPVGCAGELELAGETLLYANGSSEVIIGPPGARDPSELLSTVGHEVGVDVQQINTANWAPSSSPVGDAVNELEVYDFEIANRGRTGIGPAELAGVRQLRSEYYDVIRGTPYQVRIDAGNYQLFPKDVIQ